jgi:hypothetical protein
MKSIKEKSNEYAKEYLFSPLPQRAPNIHFEAGANYVLEEIDKLVKFNRWAAQDLYELIEQLKK